jgi:tRNA (cmo5U34)-methyltransferase
MADSFRSIAKDEHEHDADHHRHDHSPHHWESAEYVANWARGQDRKETERAQAFQVLADTIRYEKSHAIAILDLGAGYGGLTQFLLGFFPSATAVCLDGSEEMARLGRERMKNFAGRFEYVIGDLSRHGWSKLVPGPFAAVVSSIAIHNVNSPQIIRGIYEDIYPLVQQGGCFLNFDRHHPPIEEQIKWLRGAGFQNVQCFWRDDRRAVFGGFKNG